jgi:hypothetical protein
MSLTSTPFDLPAALRHHSTDWFLEICQRFNVTPELVNEHGAFGLPVVARPTSVRLRRLLAEGGDAAMRAAIAGAIQSRTTQMNVEGLYVTCLPCAGGALVLARECADEEAAAESSGNSLDVIGPWLAGALEAHLQSAPKHGTEALERVSTLHRVLSEAAQGGGEREIVEAFAEAMAVWNDIDVRGYVEDIRGHFAMRVSPAGAAPQQVPASMADDLAAGSSTLVRLSPTDAARLGFQGDGDILIGRFGGTGSESWLLVLSGAIHEQQERPLAVYVEMLRELVRLHGAGAIARTTLAMLQHLLAPSDDVEAAGRAAVRELATAVDALGAAIVVRTLSGMHVLSLGDAEAFSTPRPYDQGDQIVTTSQILDRYEMVLAVRGLHGRTFTRREQQCVDEGVVILAAWLQRVLQRPVGAQDRRGVHRRFEDVVERVAARTVQEGGDVSVVVMIVAGAAFQPGLLHRYVAGIRGQLRPSDLAGTLSESEIAVLLPETSAADAAVVAARLRERLEDRGAAGDPVSASIGIASCRVGSSMEESVVRAAREDAARRACA